MSLVFVTSLLFWGCAGTADAYLICGFINAILSSSLFLRPLSVSVIFLSHDDFVIISTVLFREGKKLTKNLKYPRIMFSRA